MQPEAMIPVGSHPFARRPAGHRTHVARSVVAVALIACLAVGCGGDDRVASEPTTTTVVGAVEPRQMTAAEADRLAVFRRLAYDAEIRSVDGVVVSDDATVQFRGWIHTVDHWAYGMMTGEGVAPFLVLWSQAEVAAQDFAGTEPPLPVPVDGWESTALDHEASHLAAAQVLLLSLASNTAENPQLLRQSGAMWLRADRIGDVPVDVLSGPIPDGATSSSYRYWIDATGNLLRLEARLDGVHWSSFNFADATSVGLQN